jgi:hypothetical protein
MENIRFNITKMLECVLNVICTQILYYADFYVILQHPQNVRDETLEALADAQVSKPKS